MNRCINKYINNVSKASDEQNAKRYRLFCTFCFSTSSSTVFNQQDIQRSKF